ncbi:hypothetical protein CEE37_01320 [candidate division LCP-89 bacterium B3_LCP]|uniref:Gingipain domain-containing protein n=1 Tax=candidate division LCP-89 bacterium B3_LCP TaxID=2012998 RepID=A0A532V580_UNCL8|nr:MAG: hypothetical protein CEE37_01320 [candidate division LCP-89 bacterium B3_LCP]
MKAQNTEGEAILKMGKMPRLPDGNGFMVPGYSIILPGHSNDLKVKVVDVKTAIFPLNHPPCKIKEDETLTAGKPGSMSIYSRNEDDRKIGRIKGAINSSRWVSHSDLGQVNHIPISVLKVAPVRWQERASEVKYLTSLAVKIDFPSRPNKGQKRVTLPKSLRSLSADLPLPVFSNPPNNPPQISSSTNQERLKIFISQEGICHLESADLASWGVSLSGEDPRTIRLENKGQELPIYVYGEADGRFDENDYIEFWGEGLHSTYIDQNPEIYSDLYTDVNVYWLSWGGPLGARLVEESGEVVEVNELNMFRATSYPYFLHKEDNVYYNRLSQVDPDSLKEHWYYDGGVSASETRDYNVFLPYPDQNSLVNTSVRVSLQGLTYPDAYGQGGQHHAYVSLQDQNSAALEAGSSGASWWLGQTGVILDAQGDQGINPSELIHGNNQLSIFVPVDTEAGPNDTILLNWFQITYHRLYQAHADFIFFSPPEAAMDTLVDFRIEGFNSPQISIFKLGQSKIINAEVIPYQVNDETYYKLHFQDRPYGFRDYIAFTPAARLLPDSTQFDEGSDISTQLTTGAPVELLVIANRDFENHPGLLEYIGRKILLVGRTDLVFIDDVFDEFSDGIYSPQAIKDLLLFLPTTPKYLTLVGDGSYDTRNTYGYGGNLMPAHYIQTKAYGAVASDYWYSLLTDDLMPDLAVGRISARTEEELTDFLDKLEKYETDPESGAWHSTHLFVSGTGGVAGTSFLSMSQDVISRLETDVMVERLATDPVTSPFYGGTGDLIELFDKGALVVDYNGHGAGAVWSDNSLFRLENLPMLSNQGKYPFVTNFTCFIGAFDAPQQNLILGEEFIFEPQKGAIGVLGSTGLGWFINGGWLQEELVNLLYDNPDLSLGELINAAKIAYYAYYGLGGSEESFDTMHLMNLLGDPSLFLAFADVPAIVPEITPEFVSYGDSVEIHLDGNYGDYQGKLRIYDEYNYPALQYSLPFEVPLIPSVSGMDASFILPALGDSVSLSGGTYRFSFWETSGEESNRLAAPLYLLSAYSGSTVVDSLNPNPNPVYASDEFRIEAKLLDAQGIDTAWVHVLIETNEGIFIAEDDLGLAPASMANWYQSEAVIDSSFYGYNVQDRVVLQVHAVDAESDTTLSDEVIFYILDSRPDPEWVAGSLTTGMRETLAVLLVEVENLGQSSIDSVDVAFYYEGVLPAIGSAVIYDLDAGMITEAYIPSDFSQPGSYDIEVEVNGEGWIDDANPTDPYAASLIADHFTITSAIGTGDTLSIDDTFHAYIPPGGITNPQGVIVFRQLDDLVIPSMQNGLSFVLQDTLGYFEGMGFEFDLLGGAEIIADSLKLIIDIDQEYDSLLTSNDLAIHVQRSGQPYWQLLAGEVQTVSYPPNPSYRVTANHNSVGYFTLLLNQDHQGPVVEISVEGQIYTDGGYVPSQPKISALVQDPSGVNSDLGTYWITVDGAAVDSNLVSVATDNSGQVMTLSINPVFNVGSHSVSVWAEDFSGNQGSASIQFEVMGEFRLDFIGNYPNPFKDKTYFAYRLTEQTTEPVAIRIYTVSGRLIRTLYSSSPDEINYSEIYWDGRDDDGSNIANGVYFYKITAKRGDQEIERTMKMAKLR